MTGFHTLTYRPGDGTVTVLKISAARDLGEVLGEIQRRLFDISPEDMRRMELHALAVLAGRK